MDLCAYFSLRMIGIERHRYMFEADVLEVVWKVGYVGCGDVLQR